MILGFGAPPEDPRAAARRKLATVHRRLKRAYAMHRKEVMYVEPVWAKALIAEGLCVEAGVADYDAALDSGGVLPFDPRYHYPVRLKTIKASVPKPLKGPGLVVPRRFAQNK